MEDTLLTNETKMRMAIAVVTASIVAILSAGGAEAKSLWSADSPANYLFTGANSSKVGEIVTIVVQENNRANDTADGEATREQDVNGVFSMLFNNRFMNKVFGDAADPPRLQYSSSNEFTGEAAVDRSNQFNSRIAATIVRIDPVGNYLIEARKTIRIGEERKIIVLSGKIRPQDISVDNTVSSSQVADAEISYLGDGTLTKMSNPNFIQKLFNFLF